jgi:hypothetical protein
VKTFFPQNVTTNESPEGGPDSRLWAAVAGRVNLQPAQTAIADVRPGINLFGT